MNRRPVGRFHRMKAMLKDFLIGMTVHDLIQEVKQRIRWHEAALMSVVIGDMLGFPICCYYRLRLFPYWVPRLEMWKRNMLRERDIVERFG